MAKLKKRTKMISRLHFCLMIVVDTRAIMKARAGKRIVRMKEVVMNHKVS